MPNRFSASTILPVTGSYPLRASPGSYFQRNPSLVASDAVLTASETLFQLVREITEKINRHAWIPEDRDAWDHSLPGDCENFALRKRQSLGEAGVDLGGLRVCVGRVPRLGHHAVLHVVTDAGDYVLDNLNDEVMPWRTSLHIPVWRTGAKDGTPSKEVCLLG